MKEPERSLQDPHSERARPSPLGVPEESLGRGDEREGVGRRELESQALEDVLRHIAQGESVGGRREDAFRHGTRRVNDGVSCVVL